MKWIYGLAILALVVSFFVPWTSGGGGAEEPIVLDHPDAMSTGELSSRVTRILDSAHSSERDQDREKQDATPKVKEAVQRTADRATVDEEWLRFTRSRRNPESWITDAKDAKLDTASMFRHVMLNRHDVYIPKQRRGQLAPLLRPFVEQFALLSKLEWKYQEEQLRLLVMLGKIKPRPKKPTAETIRLARVGAKAQLDGILEQIKNGREETASVKAYVARMKDQVENPEKHAHQVVPGRANVAVLHDGDGDIYELDVRRLPGQRTLSEGREFLRLEIMGRLIEWFRAQKTLSQQEAAKLISALADPNRRKE